MLVLEAEGPSHAAAAGIHFFDLEALRQSEDCERRPGADQRLLVTVAMQQKLTLHVLKLQVQLTTAVQCGQEFFNHEAISSYGLDTLIGHEIRVFIAQR